MDIESKTAQIMKFPSRPNIAKEFSEKMKLVSIQSNHFPLKYDFKNSHVYSYHLKFNPEIPEDSRQLRQAIICSLSSEIKEKLNGDFYTSGMIVYGNKKIDKLITFETKVNRTKYSVALNFDT